MWMRASARQAPPTRYRSRPAASGQPRHRGEIGLDDGARLHQVAARRARPAGSPQAAACSPRRVAPSSSRTSSSEPPPISASTPSADGMPHSSPAADSSASCSPVRMRTGTPGMRACRPATNAGPFFGVPHGGRGQHLEGVGAHGAGDGGIAVHHRQCLRHAVLVQPAGALQPAAEPQHRLFVEDRHRIAAGPSYTTRRTEFEPRSTTAQRGRSAGGVYGMSATAWLASVLRRRRILASR